MHQRSSDLSYRERVISFPNLCLSLMLASTCIHLFLFIRNISIRILFNPIFLSNEFHPFRLGRNATKSLTIKPDIMPLFGFSMAVYWLMSASRAGQSKTSSVAIMVGSKVGSSPQWFFFQKWNNRALVRLQKQLPQIAMETIEAESESDMSNGAAYFTSRARSASLHVICATWLNQLENRQVGWLSRALLSGSSVLLEAESDRERWRVRTNKLACIRFGAFGRAS